MSRLRLAAGRVFLGAAADPPRNYAFSARDRIDETVQRIRSVRDARYHYIRNFTPGPTFASLNRYKEKCFPDHAADARAARPRQTHRPAGSLMELRGPSEELYDTEVDPHEIQNLVGSTQPQHVQALTASAMRRSMFG